MVEWTGETPAVEVYKFDWTKFVVCDMTEARLLRVEMRGTWRTVLAFSEEKEHWSKKITYGIGIISGDTNRPHWIQRN